MSTNFPSLMVNVSVRSPELHALSLALTLVDGDHRVRTLGVHVLEDRAECPVRRLTELPVETRMSSRPL